MELIMNFFKKKQNKNFAHETKADQTASLIKHGTLIRYQLFFSGRVQHVGFRFEAEQAASQLMLTGWVKNLDNGQVAMELQGSDSKITQFLTYMQSLEWVKITQIDKKILPVDSQETSFSVRG